MQDVRTSQNQVQQLDVGVIIRQCSRASEATAEAVRNLEEASATVSVTLGHVREIVENTHTTRGAARAYQELLVVASAPMDEASSAAVKLAKIRRGPVPLGV